MLQFTALKKFEIKTGNRGQMSRFFLPTQSERDHALQRLRTIEKQFEDAVAFHDRESQFGGVRLATAATRLAKASRAYRNALLDPNLPPI
jgi:hypothetical protein